MQFKKRVWTGEDNTGSGQGRVLERLEYNGDLSTEVLTSRSLFDFGMKPHGLKVCVWNYSYIFIVLSKSILLPYCVILPVIFSTTIGPFPKTRYALIPVFI